MNLHSRFVTAGVFPRVATADIALGNSLIHAGETVIPITDSANRDTAVYRDPDTLDITRKDPAPHLAFGHGPHFCIGAALARLQLQIGLASLLTRFPDLRLAIPADDGALDCIGFHRR